jgi:hypothetical protein
MGIKDIFDDDLFDRVAQDPKFLTMDQALLIQILRELRKEGPEEKSKPVGGFSPF